jgi:putative membrane protein
MVPFEALGVAAVAAMGIAYAVRANSLAAQGRPVPAWRMLSFAGSIVVLAIALASPLEQLTEELVTAHMVQHLLILDVAALLFVLGLTGPMLQPVLAIRGLRWLRALAHPIVSFLLWILVLYAWHVPALYEGATFDSDLLHALEHACFFAAGVGIWISLFGPLPKPAWFGNGARVVYVIAVRLAGAVLANVLMWAGFVLYPRYAPGQAEHGIDPLTDQGIAGIVMMFESTVITLAVLAWLFFRWAAEDTERQELLDFAASRGVSLTVERAGRAVAAGQGDRLRERIGDGR